MELVQEVEAPKDEATEVTLGVTEEISVDVEGPKETDADYQVGAEWDCFILCVRDYCLLNVNNKKKKLNNENRIENRNEAE